MYIVEFTFLGDDVRISPTWNESDRNLIEDNEFLMTLDNYSQTIVQKSSNRFSEVFEWCKCQSTGVYRKGRHIVYYFVDKGIQ